MIYLCKCTTMVSPNNLCFSMVIIIDYKDIIHISVYTIWSLVLQEIDRKCENLTYDAAIF